MTLNVETDQVRSQQPIQEFTLPRANSKAFGIGPRNVPEDGNPRIRTPLFDDPRQKRKVIVLHQHYWIVFPRDFFQHRGGELFIHGLIRLPIIRAKGWPRMRNVAQGPKTFVGEAQVEPPFLLWREPHSAQRVLGMVGRNPHAAHFVHHFVIRIAGGLRDPGTGTGPQNGFERRH